MPCLQKRYRIGMTEFFCARSYGNRRNRPRRTAVIGQRRHTSRIGERAIFLDRDGVLNRDTGYVAHACELRLYHRVLPLLHQYKQAGYRFIVVTNQSGVDRGYFTERNIIRCNQFLIWCLRRQRIVLDALYYCPSSREGDPYRKPHPGMLLAAATRYRIRLSQSLMIGDRMTDCRAAWRAGVGHSILLPQRAGRLWRPRVVLGRVKRKTFLCTKG